MIRDMNLQYAGSADVFGDPYAFAPNGVLGGQPPLFVLNSENDFLRASGEAYADALRGAGVDVTIVMEPGTSHGHLNGPDQPGPRAASSDLSDGCGTTPVDGDHPAPRRAHRRGCRP